MRLSHFETLKPVCPRCRTERQLIAPLTLATVNRQEDNHILEGVLHCSNADCQLEYPIIDGIPIIVPYIRKYLADNYYHINAREDFSQTIESILGDAVGPGTFLDATRQHLSSYAFDHYNDLNPNPDKEASLYDAPSGGSIVACLDTGLRLIEDNPVSEKGRQDAISNPMIDIGCAVGRTTFELANRYPGICLGIDINFSMLRVAQKVLRESLVQFPLKRLGVVYDRQEFKVEFENATAVDFWACDALALPFEEATFGFASGLNVFDSVTSPRDLLVSIGHILKPAATAVIATPYDWSPAATPIETWVGGHSQRGPDHGAAEPLLRKLLTAGAHPHSVKNLELIGELNNQPWWVRVHERNQTLYRTHIVAVRAT